MKMPRNILPAMITGLVTFGMASAAVAQKEPLLPAFDNDTPLELSEVQESVDYLMNTYAVSQEEALRRLEAQRSAPVLAEALAAQFPDEYAGMWLDQEGGGVLVVGTTRPDRLADLQSRVPQHVWLRLAQANWSLRELTKTADRVKARMGSDRLAQSTVVVDEKRNLVVSYTRDDDPDLRTQILRSVTLKNAAMAEQGRVVTEPLKLGTTQQAVVEPPPPPESCSPEESMLCAPPPMRGGMRLNIDRDDPKMGLGGCTNGFNVEGVGRYNTGLYYTLVAGHCLIGDNHHKIQHSNHNDIPVGYESGPEYFPYPNDFAIMRYYSRDLSDFWLSGGGRNLVLSVSCPRSGCHSLPDVPISGTKNYDSIKIGDVVCAIGSADETSLPKEQAEDSEIYKKPDITYGKEMKAAMGRWVRATRCGKVINKNGGIVTDLCARPGDSGGPLYGQHDHLAYGILNGGGGPGMKELLKMGLDAGVCNQGIESNQYTPISKIFDIANSFPAYVYRIIDHP